MMMIKYIMAITRTTAITRIVMALSMSVHMAKQGGP